MDNLREASVVKEMLVVGVAHLEQMIEFFRGRYPIEKKKSVRKQKMKNGYLIYADRKQ